ncbi:MAG TPA: cytochrome c oxidase assembly protein [Acidimicrobiales bacterium]|nr:cytochrome c oxidase assembly protein [Acidimicrobiales bacterium]
MSIQPFSWHHLNQWHLGVLALLLLFGASYLYARGVMRVPTWPRVRSVSFAAGIIVTFLATQSIIGVYDMVYFSDHMIQHLLLIMVAAPLFALSAPLDLAYDAGHATLRRWLDSKFMARLTHPLSAFIIYFLFIPITHLTGLFNLMMQQEWFHHLEQIGFLVVGYLFFRAAFGLERGVKLHPGLRLVFVMAAVPVDTFTGLVLSMSSTIPYNNYLAMSPVGSTRASVLLNLHLGGGYMWIGGDALMLLACIPISIMWVKWETVRTKELDAILDAQGI